MSDHTLACYDGVTPCGLAWGTPGEDHHCWVARYHEGDHECSCGGFADPAVGDTGEVQCAVCGEPATTWAALGDEGGTWLGPLCDTHLAEDQADDQVDVLSTQPIGGNE